MKLYYPFKGPKIITQRFGERKLKYPASFGFKHPGTDFAAPFYEPVLACENGGIRLVGLDGDWGLKVIIRHSQPIDTEYCHLAWSDVKMGDQVKRGDIIGYVGSTGKSTGNHLHLGYIDRSIKGLGRQSYHDPEYYLNLNE